MEIRFFEDKKIFRLHAGASTYIIQQDKVAHKYVLGLYSRMERILMAFCKLLLEGYSEGSALTRKCFAILPKF